MNPGSSVGMPRESAYSWKAITDFLLELCTLEEEEEEMKERALLIRRCSTDESMTSEACGCS
jgi:hypothetical protein